MLKGPQEGARSAKIRTETPTRAPRCRGPSLAGDSAGALRSCTHRHSCNRARAQRIITDMPSRVPRCRGPSLAGDSAGALLSHVLLPPLTWRAGKTAAAIRFAAVSALATLLRRRLVQPKALLQLIGDGTLLPLLAQELDEDWWVWGVKARGLCYIA